MAIATTGEMRSGTQPGGKTLYRLAGLAVVAALHVAVIYGLVTNLAQRTIDVVRAPIETHILPPDAPVPPPAPPAPKLAPPPPLYVPPPVVQIAPPPVPSRAVTAVTPVKPPEPAPPIAVPRTAAPAAHQAVRVQPRLDPARSRDPEYPAASKRLGEQGSLIVQVLVDPDGRPRDVRLIESCGSPRLDQAALAGIRSSYRFIPGTLDGKPEAQWFTFRFVWKLK